MKGTPVKTQRSGLRTIANGGVAEAVGSKQEAVSRRHKAVKQLAISCQLSAVKPAPANTSRTASEFRNVARKSSSVTLAAQALTIAAARVKAESAVVTSASYSRSITGPCFRFD
jgi:hypothetical protein